MSYKLVECRGYVQEQRFRYWRCINPGNHAYTLVRKVNQPGVLQWLQAKYEKVDEPNDTLPYWRLYQVIPDTLDMVWFN